MKELEIISAVRSCLARAPQQCNSVFGTDAEIVDFDGLRLAITVDDYSAEDQMPADDPGQLGWNLVIATISDLLAVGAKPRHMLNSMVTAPWMTRSYLTKLSAGMRTALDACGATMLGGDTGIGADWRFTGIALGSFAADRSHFGRRTEVAAGAVLATGTFGDANLAAGAGGPGPRFEARMAEAAAVVAAAAIADQPSAVACIDTSDGLMSALETLRAVNDQLEIRVDVESIPLAPGVSQAATAIGIPPEVFLLGAAGEYELVTLVPEHMCAMLGDQQGFTRIGSFTTTGEPGIFYRPKQPCGSKQTPRLIRHKELPDPRAAKTLSAYRDAVIAIARDLFEPGGRS